MTLASVRSFVKKSNQWVSVAILALFYLTVIGFGRLLWQGTQLFKRGATDSYWEDGETRVALESAY